MIKINSKWFCRPSCLLPLRSTKSRFENHCHISEIYSLFLCYYFLQFSSHICSSVGFDGLYLLSVLQMRLLLLKINSLLILFILIWRHIKWIWPKKGWKVSLFFKRLDCQLKQKIIFSALDLCIVLVFSNQFRNALSYKIEIITDPVLSSENNVSMPRSYLKSLEERTAIEYKFMSVLYIIFWHISVALFFT